MAVGGFDANEAKVALVAVHLAPSVADAGLLLFKRTLASPLTRRVAGGPDGAGLSRPGQGQRGVEEPAPPGMVKELARKDQEGRRQGRGHGKPAP